jgi:hypothetical protein
MRAQMPKANLKPRFWIMKLAKSCLFLNQRGRRGGEGKGSEGTKYSSFTLPMATRFQM